MLGKRRFGWSAALGDWRYRCIRRVSSSPSRPLWHITNLKKCSFQAQVKKSNKQKRKNKEETEKRMRWEMQHCTCGWASSLAPPHPAPLASLCLYPFAAFCWWVPSSSLSRQSRTPPHRPHQRHHRPPRLTEEAHRQSEPEIKKQKQMEIKNPNKVSTYFIVAWGCFFLLFPYWKYIKVG